MKRALICLFVYAGAVVANAQTTGTQSDLNDLRERVNRLEESHHQGIKALTEDVANLKLNAAVPELANESFYGLGVGASKVYYSKSPLSLGGYGEVIYMDVQGGANTTDAYRFVPYIGYRFSDKIILNAELEFEHGGANAGAGKGEAVIEFAYLDFLPYDYANLRIGHILVPVGLININHEPTAFPMVQRPDVEKNIIPSTWHENGILLFGGAGGVTYSVGTVNSGYAGQFSDSSWIRGGRQKGAQAQAEDWSGVARVDWEGIPGVMLGASVYHGDQSQDAGGLGRSTLTLWEAHTRLKFRGIDFSALYAHGSLGDIELINAGTAKNVGKEVEGYYAILSYDLLPVIRGGGDASLPVFVAYEAYDLHKAVAADKTRDKNLDKSIVTFGLNYRPVSNVTLKADYQLRDSKGNSEGDRFELGVGWVF